jgi:hypothetical protein
LFFQGRVDQKDFEQTDSRPQKAHSHFGISNDHPIEISVSPAAIAGLSNVREVAREADAPPKAEGEDDEGEDPLRPVTD